MSVLKVTQRDGETRELEGVEGWRVMELLRDYGTGVEGICGGQVDCASCHVYVAKDWLDKLPDMREDEEDKLDELPTLQDNSRLSCQLIWDDSLDGLELTVAPD